MLPVIIGFVLIIAGVQAFTRRRQPVQGGPQGWTGNMSALFSGPLAGALMVVAGLGFLSSTSFMLIDADKVGHLKRIYFADDLPPGRIIALSGQKGPQAEILGPGFHFRPLLNVLYEVETFDVVEVPEGYYGQITALDGAAMPEGMFISPLISDDKLSSMRRRSLKKAVSGVPRKRC